MAVFEGGQYRMVADGDDPYYKNINIVMDIINGESVEEQYTPTNAEIFSALSQMFQSYGYSVRFIQTVTEYPQVYPPTP